MDRIRSANGETDGVRGQYDWTTTRPSEAVIEIVSIATESDQTGFGPLYKFVDPDALDALFASGAGLPNSEMVATFRFVDHDITVHGDGNIVVRPSEA